MTEFYYIEVSPSKNLVTKSFSSLKDLLSDAFKNPANVHFQIGINQDGFTNKIWDDKKSIRVIGFNPGNGMVDLADEFYFQLKEAIIND